ncbi:uncharacterized protein LOC115891553 [Sitophilus oryzae]|uniref:Uncharacterized protein LOC115891553 n=1 Tax=Sitophilus oryzae TaxID=7048 RepID=A0A6J2YXJ3_SITOR|nr:uncharacterized protein LOC115891553 [Sitophilus oryzae]
MAELKALLAERRQLKSSLTRFKHFLEKQNSSEQIALSELDVRLSQIQDHLKKFEDIQLKIEILSTENESSDVLEDINERDSFESNFYSAISLASDISNQYRITEQNHEHSIDNNDIRTVDNKVFDNLQQVRLPQLNLPTFNGDYSEWLFFRDSFKSLIHENVSLDIIQKFHYLRLLLKGEAAQVVQSLGVSANNYDTAWSLLNARYENIPLLVGNHVRAIFNLPNLNEESHVGLRQLLDGVTQHTRALEVLGQPVNSWDTLLIHILISKLDGVSRRAWEAQNSSNVLPTFRVFKEFLQEKCRVLEAISQSSSKSIRGEKRIHITV